MQHCVRIISTPDEFKSLAEEWDSLIADSYSNVVHLTHNWLVAWWRHYGGAKQMYVIAIYDGGGLLVGAVPFMQSHSINRGVRMKKLELMANGISPSSDILIRRGQDVSCVTEALFRFLSVQRVWDIIEFTKLEQGAESCVAILRYLRAHRYPFGCKDNIESPFIRIQGQWESFLSQRSTKFRKTLRNKLNRTKKVKGLRIEKFEIESGHCAEVADMFLVSAKSWKRKTGTDLDSNPKIKGFLKEICDRFGSKRCVNFWRLRINNETAAFEFHLKHNGVVYPLSADL